MVEKTSELQEIIIRYSQGKEANLNPFTMVFKGVLDAAVNGGISAYGDAFFNDAYRNENPPMVSYINLLQEAFNIQNKVLGAGLTLHGQLCPGSLQQQMESKSRSLLRLTRAVGYQNLQRVIHALNNNLEIPKFS